jgi:hypothetical protein
MTHVQLQGSRVYLDAAAADAMGMHAAGDIGGVCVCVCVPPVWTRDLERRSANHTA